MRWRIPTRDEDKLEELPNPGDFHWRSAGERHAWEPMTIANLQTAARTNSNAAYVRSLRSRSTTTRRANCTLRGLIDLKPRKRGSIPLEDVEPASEIVKRFVHRRDELRLYFEGVARSHWQWR